MYADHQEKAECDGQSQVHSDTLCHDYALAFSYRISGIATHLAQTQTLDLHFHIQRRTSALCSLAYCTSSQASSRKRQSMSFWLSRMTYEKLYRKQHKLYLLQA